MCFVDKKKSFDSVSRQIMEWATGKKSLLEIIFQAVMSLYDGAQTGVRWDLHIEKSLKSRSVQIKDLCCGHSFLQ